MRKHSYPGRDSNHGPYDPWPSRYIDYAIPVPISYLVTPWSRVLLKKLTGFAANQEIPPFYGTPKLITHKRPPPVPVLSQLHPVPTTPSHFLRIRINIILPSTSRSPQWSLSLRFPHQNLVHTSVTSHKSSLFILIFYRISCFRKPF